VQLREDFRRRLDAEVGFEQACFEFVEELGVDAPARQEVRDEGGAAIDTRAQAREKAALRCETGFYGWITAPFVMMI
jgi:hypothetical protein